ncbi:MAG: HAD family hydrolase [Anaerolineae bacterium]|nr:HAD family hydrolase [Anaerolineae bacterium]
MPRWTIFLDDGGVMSNNRVRGPQWQRLVGEFFAPRLGGTPEAWAAVNRVVADRLFAEYERDWAGRTDVPFEDYWTPYQIRWLSGMCEALSLPIPPPKEAYRLAEEATVHVTHRVNAAFPGVVEVVRELHGQGYSLHTASGERSGELNGYLTNMGIRDCFTHLYGPDLIGTLKQGPAYYERLLADCGVAPADALFVDDSPLVMRWVTHLGATGVLVHPALPIDTQGAHVISRLADLPIFLDELD